MQVSSSFLDVVSQYFAECIFVPLFLLALIWIWKKWNIDRKRAIVGIGAASILVFNELTYRIFVAIGEGSTYYRMFWIIPIVLVVAAFLVDMIMSVGKIARIVMVLSISVACVMFSTKSGIEWFKVPQNVYQISNDVIQVSDAIMELTGGEPTYMIDDGSVSGTIRQYNAKIKSTDTALYYMDLILLEYYNSIYGKDIQNSIRNNHSRFIVLQKEKKNAVRLVEAGGAKLAAETDNHYVYYIDYDRLYEDTAYISELGQGEWNRINMEYVPVYDLKESFEFVYVSDFGESDNEAVYRDVINKMQQAGAECVIINTGLSKNCEWVEVYEKQLSELGIACYYNDKEFQLVDMEEVSICMIDNLEGIKESSLIALESALKEKEHVIIVLSKLLNESEETVFCDLICREENSIVGILSVKERYTEKNIIGNNILQYATPSDDTQMFNIIRVDCLEPEEIILY